MIPNYTHLLTMSVVIITLNIAGCSGKSAEKPTSSVAMKSAGPPATIEAHAHVSEGPHGGSLIELGNEEYHAELVHDDAAKTVTIYVLDSAAKSSVPIDAIELIINLKHQGKGEQFKLAALADQSDPPGKSSRFMSSDSELAEDLDREDAEPQLVVNINGKQFRGAVKHSH